MGNWVESHLRYERVTGLATFLKWPFPPAKSWDPECDPVLFPLPASV